MTKDIIEMYSILVETLKTHENVFKIVLDTTDKFEVIGTKTTMQGKKKVDGHYFSTLMQKPKDVRFYFFPAYTHPDEIKPLMNETVTKFLKGKSCFHIKKMDASLEASIGKMIDRGIDIYQDKGIITST